MVLRCIFCCTTTNSQKKLKKKKKKKRDLLLEANGDNDEVGISGGEDLDEHEAPYTPGPEQRGPDASEVDLEGLLSNEEVPAVDDDRTQNAEVNFILPHNKRGLYMDF